MVNLERWSTNGILAVNKVKFGTSKISQLMEVINLGGFTVLLSDILTHTVIDMLRTCMYICTFNTSTVGCKYKIFIVNLLCDFASCFLYVEQHKVLIQTNPICNIQLYTGEYLK